MDRLDEATRSTENLLREASKPSRGRYSSQYHRVSWHIRRHAWRTKVKVRNQFGRDLEFYRTFDNEKTAAAVADIVAMMILPDPRRLNFDWSHGENHLPQSITVKQILDWVEKQGLPVIRKPGGTQ